MKFIVIYGHNEMLLSFINDVSDDVSGVRKGYAFTKKKYELLSILLICNR